MPSYNENLDDLGGKQKKIYYFIKDYLEENGYPPSVRDICEAVGLSSTSTVHGHLNRLEKKGLIRRDHSKTRAIGLIDVDLETKSKAMTVPMVGQVTAGMPILAVENIEEYFPLPASFVRDEHSFVLRVQGESMIEAGIYDGDYIVVRQQSYADDGDIVVALIEDESTVKRFFHDGKRIRLQPENPTMDPMYFDEVSILGKVTGLFRRIK
ncbi:MAG: transcriptional repressor LexA [Eubacteriales bacterium]|nr:transcriptional repressor LexA [Eubacteriales bacterium]